MLRLPYDVKDIAEEWLKNIQRIRNSFDKIQWNEVMRSAMKI